MTASNRVSQLKEMISLEEKRAQLQKQLASLDEQLAHIQGELYGSAGASKQAKGGAAKAKAAPAEAGRKGRGALREQILEALQAAGARGATVQELSSLLGTKTANIHSWFSTNAKKISGIKKIGEARYALNGAAAKAAKAEKAGKPAKAPKAAKAPKTAKAATAPKAAKIAAAPKARGQKGPAKRGELKERILDVLTKAGESGITIKDLSDELGVKYKNLYIWFVTTGKRISGIEKAGPARYRLMPAK